MEDDFGSDADFLALATAAEQSSISRRPAPAAPPARPAAQAPPAGPSPQKKVTQPTPQALPQRTGPSAILVSPRQKGNPLLAHIHALPWEYSDTPADYVVGATTCALFLSLKYHRLHPEYVYARIRALGKKYALRVLLTLVDIEHHEQPLRELAKTALVNELTLVLAWSAKEAARYLEAYKALERAGPAGIRGAPANSYADRLVEFATVPRGVNRADAVALVSQFGSVRGAVNALPEEVAMLQGWGKVKVDRWCEAVREPFRVKLATKRGEGTGGGEGVVPLGRAPNVPRTGTRDGLQQDAAEQRPAVVGEEQDTTRDEEMARALAAAEEDHEQRSGESRFEQKENQGEGAPAKRPRVEAPELSEGVQAALAKLRS